MMLLGLFLPYFINAVEYRKYVKTHPADLPAAPLFSTMFGQKFTPSFRTSPLSSFFTFSLLHTLLSTTLSIILHSSSSQWECGGLIEDKKRAVMSQWNHREGWSRVWAGKGEQSEKVSQVVREKSSRRRDEERRATESTKWAEAINLQSAVSEVHTSACNLYPLPAALSLFHTHINTHTWTCKPKPWHVNPCLYILVCNKIGNLQKSPCSFFIY